MTIKILLSCCFTSIFSLLTGCSSLKSVKLPDSILYLNEKAFELCLSMTEIHIPNSVIRISNGMFIGCAKLHSITIPDSIDTIEKMEYDHNLCKRLISQQNRYDLPDRNRICKLYYFTCICLCQRYKKHNKIKSLSCSNRPKK